MTAGAGHRRAAEAIAEAVRIRQPLAVVDCVDLLSLVPAWLRAAYPGLYELLVTHAPWAWGVGYHGTDASLRAPGAPELRRAVNRLVTFRFRRWLADFRPDVTLATHFFSADALADALPRVAPIVVITDLFPHRLWLVRGAGEYVVGSDWTRAACERRGIPAARVHALGIPVSPRFLARTDRDATLRALGLDPARRTVLMTGGGMGLAPMQAVWDALRAAPRAAEASLQVILVCGSNAHSQRQLESLVRGAPIPARVLGFVDTMPALMQASDVLISKAGGMTMMEALACGLPQVMTGVIPGQEQFNAHFLIEQGAGCVAEDAVRAAALALEWLAQPERLALMRSRAHACARPSAAFDIVDRLVIPRVSLHAA